MVDGGLEKIWTSGNLNGNLIVNLGNCGLMLMVPVEEAEGYKKKSE